MIRTAFPIRYDRRTSSGRNQPLRIVVQTIDGEEHEVFLKVSGMPELDVEGLANEALAVCLAGDLGLPTLEPFFVNLPEPWIDTIPDQGIRGVLRNSAPVGFGSTAAGQQWKIWSSDEALGQERRRAALAIFAFDVYCENSDRRPGENPNCLIKGNEFRIFDHELCFWMRTLLPPPEPWRAGYVHGFITGDRHIFGRKLKGKDLEFNPIRDAWSALRDDHLQDYVDQLPAAWATANNGMADAIAHIRNVRDRIDDCLAELERALV